MVAAIAKTKEEKIIHILGRAQFKANGIILYRVQAEVNGTACAVHDVTVREGKITGCVESESGEVCKGWYYRHACCHTTEVKRAERERDEYLEYEFACGSYNHPWA